VSSVRQLIHWHELFESVLRAMQKETQRHEWYRVGRRRASSTSVVGVFRSGGAARTRRRRCRSFVRAVVRSFGRSVGRSLRTNGNADAIIVLLLALR
jgi:hypothetical protein